MIFKLNGETFIGQEIKTKENVDEELYIYIFDLIQEFLQVRDILRQQSHYIQYAGSREEVKSLNKYFEPGQKVKYGIDDKDKTSWYNGKIIDFDHETCLIERVIMPPYNVTQETINKNDIIFPYYTFQKLANEYVTEENKLIKILKQGKYILFVKKSKQ